jgi:hypothetical protein
MQIFLEGVQGGKPAEGETGEQPVWFYKGDGLSLVGLGEPLCHVAGSFLRGRIRPVEPFVD